MPLPPLCCTADPTQSPAHSTLAMGNASSSSATQQTLAVWMLARDGDSTALAAVMEQLPPELKASYLDWVDQADQRTPVAMATLLGHIDCLKLLLEAGADGNRVGRDGMGPLHLAVKADNQEITRLLLMSAQVDCNVVDARGYTPLLAAAADGRAKALDVLLQYDRVDVFACQEKSGLDVIGIANKAFKRASAIDRDTLKSALELVEKVKLELIAMTKGLCSNALSWWHSDCWFELDTCSSTVTHPSCQTAKCFPSISI